MANGVEITEGFVKDENGKIRIVPMKLPDYPKICSSANKSGEKRSTVRRKFIPLEPLIFAPACVESPVHVAKKRKTERSVCKELFKVPQKTSRFSSSNRHSVTPLGFSSKVKKNATKNGKSNINKLMPSKEQEEGEKNTPLSIVKTVLFPIADTEKNVDVSLTPGVTSLQVPSKNEITPRSAESQKEDLEFLELEKTLASAKKNKKEETVSPVTSVCSLLQNAKISSTVKKEVNRDNTLNNVLSLIKDDMKLWEDLSQQFESCQKEHQKKMSKIIELLESIGEDKENSRRSVRIANKIGNKFVVSPAIANKVDLRKTTLNKNLTKNLQYESPRTKKAVDLYNSIRSDCAVLCTPKLDRSNVDLVQTSARRSLSRRIQNQCLMLQDTPKPL